MNNILIIIALVAIVIWAIYNIVFTVYKRKDKKKGK